ncbi:MAG: hypothetical protein AAF387_05920 [Pseudomonadota bacterium]
MTSDSKQLLKLSGKIVLAWLVLSLLGIVCGKAIVESTFPLMRGFAQNITDDFYVNFAWEEPDSRMLLIDANFGVAKPSIKALGINSGASITAGTNVEHILVPLVLLFIVVICWPVSSWKQRGTLLLLSLPAGVLTLLLTTPFLLVGKVETFLQEYASKAKVVREKPLYLDWMLFTEVGGRWLLPICLGMLCVWIMHALSRDKKEIV